MGEADQLFTGANHVCVVTADVDRAVRTYADRYGVGPWSVFEFDGSNMDVMIHGEHVDFGMRVGLCSLGPAFMIELIQPIGDGNVYSDSLAAHGGADHFHHVKLEVADFAHASEHLDGLGLAKPLDGRFDGEAGSKAHGVYYDTVGDLGFLVEIGELTPDFAMTAPEYVYP